MPNQEIPVEQIGAHGEGLDIEVDVDGSSLEDPSEVVTAYHPELDTTNEFPRFAFDSLWSQRGWVEVDTQDPDAMDKLRAARQDGAPEEDEKAPPLDEDTAVPPEDGTPESGAAPAADKK